MIRTWSLSALCVFIPYNISGLDYRLLVLPPEGVALPYYMVPRDHITITKTIPHYTDFWLLSSPCSVARALLWQTQFYTAPHYVTAPHYPVSMVPLSYSLHHSLQQPVQLPIGHSFRRRLMTLKRGATRNTIIFKQDTPVLPVQIAVGLELAWSRCVQSLITPW